MYCISSYRLKTNYESGRIWQFVVENAEELIIQRNENVPHWDGNTIYLHTTIIPWYPINNSTREWNNINSIAQFDVKNWSKWTDISLQCKDTTNHFKTFFSQATKYVSKTFFNIALRLICSYKIRQKMSVRDEKFLAHRRRTFRTSFLYGKSARDLLKIVTESIPQIVFYPKIHCTFQNHDASRDMTSRYKNPASMKWRHALNTLLSIFSRR